MSTPSLDSVTMASHRGVTVVIGDLLDADGSANVFETDQAITDTATLYITLTTPGTKPSGVAQHPEIKRFIIDQVKFHMNQTNAVTYQLYLLEGSAADDLTQESYVVFDSGSAKADDTTYFFGQGGQSGTTVDHQLPVIVNLQEANKLYYIINWSGAPGNTPGYIYVRGRLLK